MVSRAIRLERQQPPITRLAKRGVGTAVPSRPRSSRRVEEQCDSVMECGAARRFEVGKTTKSVAPSGLTFLSTVRPGADAPGYPLSPLRGFPLGQARGSNGIRKQVGNEIFLESSLGGLKGVWPRRLGQLWMVFHGV